MAIISGATTRAQVLSSVKAGYFKMLQVTWLTSPIAVLIAQKFIDPALWIVWFNAVGFTLGTGFNVLIKRMKMRALGEKLRKERGEGKKGEKEL